MKLPYLLYKLRQPRLAGWKGWRVKYLWLHGPERCCDCADCGAVSRLTWVDAALWLPEIPGPGEATP